MQVIRFRSLALAGVRQLYSASSLGIDNFVNHKEKIREQFKDVESTFRAKMMDFAKDPNNMVFTEDLKHVIHLAEGSEDLDLLRKMMTKFSSQNKDMRFGSYIFGPVVMRMYWHLNKPAEALDAFRALQEDGFFDQLISFQILMDLLFNNGMHNEVLEVFDVVTKKQVKGSKYPKNAVVLAFASCYKLNTPESYAFSKKLWSDLNEFGHYPMRRAGTFAAALAIQHNEPHIALEIISSIKNQNYVTVRNLKIWALADLNRPDDALPLIRSALDSDRPQERKSTICTEVLTKLRGSIEKLGRMEVSEEFERLEKMLAREGNISENPLSDMLCSEIVTVKEDGPQGMAPRQRNFNKKPVQYTRRPGLRDMV